MNKQKKKMLDWYNVKPWKAASFGRTRQKEQKTALLWTACFYLWISLIVFFFLFFLLGSFKKQEFNTFLQTIVQLTLGFRYALASIWWIFLLVFQIWGYGVVESFSELNVESFGGHHGLMGWICTQEDLQKKKNPSCCRYVPKELRVCVRTTSRSAWTPTMCKFKMKSQI